MLAGETRTISNTETSDVAFTITSATLQFIDAAGAVTNPAVTIDNGVANVTHTVTGNVIALLTGAGPCTALWSLGISGQTILRKYMYYIAYNDVYQIIRDRLQVSSDILTDNLIDPILYKVNAMTLANYQSCFSAYLNITSVADRLYYDYALALNAASIIDSFLPNVSAKTPLISVQIGTDIYMYADPAIYSGLNISPNDQMIAEAYDMLSSISCIGLTINQTRNNFHLLQRAGNRRLARETILRHPYTDPLYEMFYDVRSQLGWDGSYGY